MINDKKTIPKLNEKDDWMIASDCPSGVPEEPWLLRADCPTGVPEEPW